MKTLTESKVALFNKDLNDLCQRHGVLITAHVTHLGYGGDGLAAHCVSNAPKHEASAACAEELLGWYRDGSFREHIRQ